MNQTLTLLDKVQLYIVILADQDLPSTSKTVAGWLLFYHHNTKTGMCTPANATIGKALAIRPENVSRHIKKLVDAGYLQARRRWGSSNSYDFDWSKGSKETIDEIRKLLRTKPPEVDMPETSKVVDQNVNNPCRNRQDPPVNNVNLILELKTRNEDGNLTLSGEIESSVTELNVDKVDVEADIDSTNIDSFLRQFQSIYPLKISDSALPAVRSSLLRALGREKTDTILDGAMRYATECVDREARFIANPVNWLNGQRWQSNDKVKADTIILGSGDSLQNSLPTSLVRQDSLLYPRPAKELAAMLGLPSPMFCNGSDEPNEYIPELANLFKSFDYLSSPESCERLEEVDAFLSGPLYQGLCKDFIERQDASDEDAEIIIHLILSTLTMQNNINSHYQRDAYFQVFKENGASKLTLFFTWLTIRNGMTFVPSPKEFLEALLQTRKSLGRLAELMVVRLPLERERVAKKLDERDLELARSASEGSVEVSQDEQCDFEDLLPRE